MEQGDYSRSVQSVVEQLKQVVQNGIYGEVGQLPSEVQLAKQFDVAVGVVRDSLHVLKREKIIIEKHGAGYFVHPKPLFTAGIEELASVSQMIQKVGMKPGTIFIDLSEVDPATHPLEQYRQTTERLFVLKRLRTADDQPIVFCIDYVFIDELDIVSDELFHTSIFDVIERSGSIFIEQAVTQVEPVAYDEEASTYLRCGIDIPLLALYQEHYSREDKMVLYSENYFRADKFHFHVVRKRV